MIRFSVIVPVYNVDKYLDKCLKSIKEQTYHNFEVIVINDGSTDDSQIIIDKYVKSDERFKSFKNKNNGLAYTRNYGIKKCNGEYFIFVDSDDTINKELLEKINAEIEKHGRLDLIKYRLKRIACNCEFKGNKLVFHNLSGEEAFKQILDDTFLVASCLYAYRRKFWVGGKFDYSSGRTHEDFGLTPYVVIKANNVSSIDYVGYNYYLRENSIMTSNSKEQILKKNSDSLYHFDRLLSLIDGDNDISESSKKLFRSYIANSLIVRCRDLDGKILKNYVDELRKRKISQYLMNDTFIRMMKKLFFKFFPELYIKYFLK